MSQTTQIDTPALSQGLQLLLATRTAHAQAQLLQSLSMG
jgi:hypothetical protein